MEGSSIFGDWLVVRVKTFELFEFGVHSFEFSIFGMHSNDLTSKIINIKIVNMR